MLVVANFFQIILAKRLKFCIFVSEIRRERGGVGFLFLIILMFFMIDKQQIIDITTQHLQNTAMFLVDVQVRPGNIIVVEIDSEDGISIEDCVLLNKNIESHFDREVEDFELEVGSAGITSPFKIVRQYQKNIGNEVEVLTKDGRKLSGVLKDCNEQQFVVTITRMEKPEGAKRKVAVEEDLTFGYDEVKYTKYQIRFK
ncbi:ribosome maturation factor RimP [Dysgonomonas sp. PH5-45]|nr:ribosome maturation factor RimP [Dysgonomonas sp. PH5-45]